MLDRKKLAVIHIVRKELGLSEEAYRHALEAATGVRSAKELDEAGFRKLMRAFARSRQYQPFPRGITFRQRLYIRHLVEDLGWSEDHFRNFLKKYHHRTEIESMAKGEASKLIESLKQVLKHRLASG